MILIVSDIKMPLDHSIDEVFKKAIKLSGVSKNNISNISIHKKSVDARKGSISIVYSVSLSLFESEKYNNSSFVSQKKEFKYDFNYEKVQLPERPVIVGAGPAGLFCCYLLVQFGLKPIVIERGAKTEERIKDVDNFFNNKLLNPSSNIQFGEGGAGTFSDGKLVTRINDKRCNFVIESFIKFGAPEEIRYLAKPHAGTDKLREIIVNMRNYLINNGAEFIYNTTVNDIKIINGVVKGVKTSDGANYSTNDVVLACGHSARDTYEMLYFKNIAMEKKPFSVGVRIEHKREFIDEGRYGKYAYHPQLKSAEYQFSLRQGNRGCYTFCMCPGGMVVAASSEENTVVTNGMSDFSRNNVNSNSAVVASVFPEDTGTDLLSGVEFQRKLEKAAFESAGASYSAPVQLSKDFINGVKTTSLSNVKPSFPCGYEFVDLNTILPTFTTDILKAGLTEFDKKIKNFSYGDAVLTGLETRTSAPLRIVRNESFESLSVKGLYPAGEGAGYAGGITSAAVDGLRVAEAILKKYLKKDCLLFDN